MDIDNHARFNDAQNLFWMGKKAQARVIVIDILRENPNDEHAWVLLSYLVDEPEKKKYALKQALGINPQNQNAQELISKLEKPPKSDKREKPEEEKESITPEQYRVQVLLKEAESFLIDKNLDDARTRLVRVLKIDSRNAQAWYLVSFLANTQKEKVEALQRAIQFDPKHRAAKIQLRELQAKSQAEPVRKSASHAPVQQKPIQQQPPVPVETITKTRIQDGSIEGSITEDESKRLAVTSSIRAWARAIYFLASKALLIGVTIFIGVFITVLIVNQSGQMDEQINQQIDRYMRSIRNDKQFVGLTDEEREKAYEEVRTEMEEELGLNLPFWPRHLLWTANALKLNWGKSMIANITTMYRSSRQSLTIRDVLLDHLPNTVLLAGAANFLIFIIGIPLSLYLARNYGNALDKTISYLTPISSIPSWVIGILLIAIFAVELRILPVGGMFGNEPPPDSALGYIPLVGRHMVLPVAAIFISLFFHLVYSWRTFFIIYATEDYVELGRAKGLPTKELENKYIFRPSISYIITNFAVTLVGFWQMTMALEVIFEWPGIGWLYVEKALPNFWGLSMYPGELLVAVGIVVLFAYLLGFVVFLLDLIYVIVDPRVTMEDTETRGEFASARGFSRFSFSRLGTGIKEFFQGSPRKKRAKTQVTMSIRLKLVSDSISRLKKGAKSALVEIWHYPSAIAGLTIISILLIGSIYAIVALPYEQIGSAWSRETLSGENRVPKLALPAWINFFRKDDYLSILDLDSRNESGQVSKSVTDTDNDMRSISIEYTFNYSYADFPQEIYLYMYPTYLEKQPFISLVWITPDGREFELKGGSFGQGDTYDFASNIPYKRMVRSNENWQEWFILEEVNTTPPHFALFADPESNQGELVKGTYKLIVNGLFFEPEGDLDAELLLLGKVYGLAGTDHLRRDLIVPLLWGMPFALLFGLFGATLTTIISMIVAAAGVWFGGGVDNLIQRLTEVNMVLPILAISVLAYAYLGINIWVILTIIIVLNVFGSPTKTYRAAFLQFKQAPYVEAARAYGASDWRIIFTYLVPRIIPVLVPQLITLIPTFVFLEATLGIFNIKSNYPTWGTVIYNGLTNGALYGSRYWVLEPLTLLLLTGLSFSLLGSALDRILNPRLVE